MLSYTTYPAPNIVAGCNLDEDKFNGHYAWIHGQMADHMRSFVLNGEFGLIAPLVDSSSLDIHVDGNILTLRRCLTMSPSGSLICIMENVHKPLTIQLNPINSGQNEFYEIFINILHSKRASFGSQSKDLPLRQMNSSSEITLSIKEKNEKRSETIDSVGIGNLKFENNKWTLEEGIPPSFHIGGHPKLMQRLHYYQQEAQSLRDSIPKSNSENKSLW